MRSGPTDPIDPAEDEKTQVKKPARNHIYLSFILFALFLGLTLYLGLQPGVRKWIHDPDSLAKLIRSYGAFAWVACIAIHFIQVVVFVIPGAVTEAVAGFVFGAPLGFALALVGIVLGSLFSFSLARWLGRPFAVRIVDGNTIAKFDLFMASHKGQAALFLAYLLPGLPKDALCYVAGATGIPYWRFLFYSTAGRLPALIFTVILGEQIARRDYLKIGLATVAFAILFLSVVFHVRLGSRKRRDTSGVR
jgi:uncharacterized membrane protein YdjX (TVP38/TMEM64 family)